MPGSFALIDRQARRRASIGAAAIRLCALALGLLALFGPSAPRAAGTDEAASSWFITDQGRVRLVAASPTVGSGAAIQLALQFELSPGWKIYWRSPGDAGYPPALDWTGSPAVDRATISWPAPIRFTLFGLDTVGYETSAVLPIELRLKTPGAATVLTADLDYLTCKDICIPYQTALELALGAGPERPSEHAASIAAAMRRVPQAEDAAGALQIKRAEFVDGAQKRLRVVVAAPGGLAKPDLFVEGIDGVAFARPTASPGVGPDEVVLTAIATGQIGTGLAGRSATLTLVDGDRAREARRTIEPGRPGGEAVSMLLALGLGLLGGFILNFMPCVLPVLSIKMIAVIQHAGGPRRAIRLGFLASAAGIVASFLLLATVLIALKTAGIAVGWGIQFQQPLFLIAMIAVLGLFAANLSGGFEIMLPGWLGGAVGRGGAGEPTLLGHFFTGVLATLLATPCSAPFLGTAVGFALAGGPAEILAVFLALGLGLALPYLAVGLVPALALWMPRPGKWMATLRRGLAVLLLGTALWLLGVLAVTTGVTGAVLVAVMVAAAAVVLCLPVRFTAIAAAALIAGALVVPGALSSNAPTARPAGDLWRRFEPQAIAGLVGTGKVVLVDVTADWCLTCQVNKRLVLDTGKVMAVLGRPDVVAMKADWTRPDETIAAYLKSFGRFGIPFNVVYGPGAPQGEPLSELLTEDAVLAALSRAAGRALVGGGSGARRGPSTDGG